MMLFPSTVGGRLKASQYILSICSAKLSPASSPTRSARASANVRISVLLRRKALRQNLWVLLIGAFPLAASSLCVGREHIGGFIALVLNPKLLADVGPSPEEHAVFAAPYFCSGRA